VGAFSWPGGILMQIKPIKIEATFDPIDGSYTIKRVTNSLVPEVGDVVTSRELKMWNDKRDVTLVITREPR